MDGCIPVAHVFCQVQVRCYGCDNISIQPSSALGSDSFVSYYHGFSHAFHLVYRHDLLFPHPLYLDVIRVLLTWPAG